MSIATRLANNRGRMAIGSIICLLIIIGIMMYLRRVSDKNLESEYAEFYEKKEDAIPDEEKVDLDDMFSLEKIHKQEIKDARAAGLTTARMAHEAGIPPEYVKGSKKNNDKKY
jgi:hypothetical protein